MHFIAKIGVASIVSNIASAIPADYSPVEKRGLAFRVDETVAKSFILSGPASVAKVYGKYSKKAPTDVTAAAANNDGTVTASPEQYDSEYLCPVSVGGQILNLDFDTGSSDLSVASLASLCLWQRLHDADGSFHQNSQPRHSLAIQSTTLPSPLHRELTVEKHGAYRTVMVVLRRVTSTLTL